MTKRDPEQINFCENAVKLILKFSSKRITGYGAEKSRKYQFRLRKGDEKGSVKFYA